MTLDELQEELLGQAEDVIAEAEAELGRDLDDEERDSLIAEFLAGLDDEEGESRFSDFCMEGVNAGKPGPCPSGVAAPDKSAKAKDVALDLGMLDRMNEGLTPMAQVYGQLKKNIPDMTTEQFQDFVRQAHDKGALRMKILNEVRTQTPGEREINLKKGDTVFGFVGAVKEDALEEFAKDYFSKGQPAKPTATQPKAAATGGYKVASTQKEATSYAKEKFSKWHDGLSGEQKAALEGYRDEDAGDKGYKALNGGLRKGNLTPAQTKQVQAIDQAIAAASLPEPLTVFRALPESILSGDTITDNGFSSTSMSEEFVKDNFITKGQVMAEIRVPAGFNAAALDTFKPLGEGYENEILLPRGTQFRVVSFDRATRRAILEAIPKRKGFSFADGRDTALTGPDGRAVERLLSAAQSQGVRVLAEATETALRRLLGKGARAATKAKQMFSDDELMDIADALAATNATAELLGRARIAERAEEAERRQGREGKFSEVPTSFHAFADAPVEPLPPLQALDYFKRLFPTLGVDPERFGPLMERQAFTLAVATGETLLNRVQDIILDRLRTGEDIRGSWEEIDGLLGDLQVTPRNPQYAEMVVRTNMMDSYNTGAFRELANHTETFPVFQYLNPSDGRSRPRHADRNRKYYSSDVPFVEVRGTEIGDAANCRCSFAPIDRWEWEELEAAGARVETDW